MANNGRYFETAELMDDALLSLLEEKDLEFITVKEVCARAGVSRSTYYLHYDSIAELLEESVSLVFRRFLDRFDEGAQAHVMNGIHGGSVHDLYLVRIEQLTPYLEFVRDNSRLFSALVRNADGLRLHDAYMSLERSVIAPILDRFGVPLAERRYLMAFYLQGLMAIIEEWMRGGCEDPIEHIARIMQKCCGRASEDEAKRDQALGT